MKRLSYETVICVDLRPFNPILKDYGLNAYMRKLGFKPTVLVFLNFFVDFLHEHQGVDDSSLNRMTVGQRGTPSEHQWTKRDLFHLLAMIRQEGIRPVLGILASTKSDVWKDVNIQWNYDEILQTKRGGETMWGGAINPLKRFKDGTYYEDEFIRGLMQVILDYGFEGYVAGDGMLGLRGPRETLLDTDFSTDMVVQFAEYHGIPIPEFADYDERADYIVKNYFAEWTAFYVHRWGTHVNKVSKALRRHQKSFMAIDSWSRNPEELITAFGIDYKVLYENGLEAVFVQARETNKWRKHREGEYVREENSVYTFLTHKTYEPRLTYYWAEATINLPEFWNSVLDLPHVLERETYGYLWTTSFANGRFSKTTEGICVIWGNDLTEQQWAWLVQRWDAAYAQIETIKRPIGLTLLWNEKGMGELVPENKQYGHRFARLLNNGLCIQSCVHDRDVEQTQSGHGADWYVSFDPDVAHRIPRLQSFLFIVAEDRIEWNGTRFGWQEGIEFMKRMSGIRTSGGRIFGFLNQNDEYLISLENAGNLFYEHIEVQVPFEIGEVKVLPPREWFAIPDSTVANSTKVSVAPDASTQIIIKRKN